MRGPKWLLQATIAGFTVELMDLHPDGMAIDRTVSAHTSW